MNEVLMTNIFFVITGIAVVAITIALLVVLYHVFKITRTLERITEKIERGAEQVSEDAALLREQLKSGKFFGTLVGYVMNLGSKSVESFVKGATSYAKKAAKDSTKRTHTKRRTSRKQKETDATDNDE